MNLGDVAELIRPWLTPVVLVAILGVVTRHYATVRRANTADRALEAGSDAEALKAFAKEVADLRDERRKDNTAHREEIEAIKDSHRKDLGELEKRNEACDRDRADLREKVEALRDLVAGYGRVIIQASADHVIALGDIPSEEVRRATARVEELFARPTPPGGR